MQTMFIMKINSFPFVLYVKTSTSKVAMQLRF